MSKVCDHTSVGMLVWNGDKLLLIERAKFPFGFAVPAGHVDDDISFGDETNNHEAAFQKAAKRELKEEVGLDAVDLELVAEGRKENPCRREGGSWHYWKFYKVDISGDIASKVVRSLDETKNVGWYTKIQIQEMVEKLEPVMYEWFKEMKIYVLGSNAFIPQMCAAKDKLCELGFEGWIHPEYEAIAHGIIDEAKAKRLAGGEHAAIKRENDYLRVHYRHILESDAILFVNLEKKGMKNYIGGNVLIEMGQAYVNNKKIFLSNDIPEYSAYVDEIKAMDPICLHGDLSNIKK